MRDMDRAIAKPMPTISVTSAGMIHRPCSALGRFLTEKAEHGRPPSIALRKEFQHWQIKITV